jgi:hypothetical protein
VKERKLEREREREIKVQKGLELSSTTARGFVPVNHFYPCMVFASKCGTFLS